MYVSQLHLRLGREFVDQSKPCRWAFVSEQKTTTCNSPQGAHAMRRKPSHQSLGVDDQPYIPSLVVQVCSLRVDRLSRSLHRTLRISHFTFRHRQRVCRFATQLGTMSTSHSTPPGFLRLHPGHYHALAQRRPSSSYSWCFLFSAPNSDGPIRSPRP